MIRLHRRYRFSASHLYRRPEWTEERNRRHFGKCANLPGHGHNYRLWISVSGEVDRETGFVVDLGKLDEVVTRRVLDVVDHQHVGHQLEQAHHQRAAGQRLEGEERPHEQVAEQEERHVDHHEQRAHRHPAHVGRQQRDAGHAAGDQLRRLQQHDADHDEQHADGDAVDVIERRMRLDHDSTLGRRCRARKHDRLAHQRTAASTMMKAIATRTDRVRRVAVQGVATSDELKFMFLAIW